MLALSRRGFTIIELIVVITAVAILASVAIVGYGTWRSDIRSTQVKNDLIAAAAAMGEVRSSNNGYPTVIPATFDASEGISLSLFETTPATYCIDGNAAGAAQHYIDQSIASEGPNPGTCASRTMSTVPPAPKNLQVVVSSNNLQLSWQASQTAASYQPRCATNSAITTGVVNANVSAPSLTATISIPSSAPYFCQVRATNSAGQSAYSVTQVGVPPGGGGPAAGWTQVAAGNWNGCGVTMVGAAYCWGYNSDGQMGNGTTSGGEDSPVAVSTSGVLGGKTIKSITVGGMHICAIASDDRAYCWGDNYSGQLGNASTVASSLPVAVSTSGVLSGKTIKSISAGYDHTCAIASDDRAYCWGNGNLGKLGRGSTTGSNVPVAVSTSGVLSGLNVTSISTGYIHTCATANNAAYCWGNGSSGQLGRNSTSSSSSPVAVTTTGALSGKTVLKVAEFSSMSDHSCVIASDNRAYCWGLNDVGQLGNNSTSNSLVPVAVTATGVLSGKNVTSIGLGGEHTCAVANGASHCWGLNDRGQLGNNSTTNSLVAVLSTSTGALSGKTLRSISGGTSFTCSNTTDNNAQCWGNGGDLGDGTTNQSNVPKTLPNF